MKHRRREVLCVRHSTLPDCVWIYVQDCIIRQSQLRNRTELLYAYYIQSEETYAFGRIMKQPARCLSEDCTRQPFPSQSYAESQATLVEVYRTSATQHRHKPVNTPNHLAEGRGHTIGMPSLPNHHIHPAAPSGRQSRAWRWW